MPDPHLVELERITRTRAADQSYSHALHMALVLAARIALVFHRDLERIADALEDR